MFKLTKPRLAVFVGLVTLSFSPLVLFGSDFASRIGLALDRRTSKN